MNNRPAISLRAPEPDDLDALYRWENDPLAWRCTSHGLLSRHALWQYVDQYDGNLWTQGQLRLVIDDAGTAVGTVDLTDADERARTARVGIYVEAPARRRGTAARALRLLHAYCRDALGLRVLAANTSSLNAPAQGLFESAGYALSGRLPSWLAPGEDLLVYIRAADEESYGEKS